MRNAHTNSMHGQSGSTLTRGLADAQVAHAARTAGDGLPAVYRVYTEDTRDAFGPFLDRAGFAGATLFSATGLYNGVVERGIVIEILGTLADRARVIRMAADIADVNKQTEVLVSWQSSRGFDVARVFGK